ncbi:MAG: hypothetical protein K8T20_19805 [Planctomycetes bacterium]|nr:hypothetical protein [Planctomycetota bacterium]
MRFFPALLALAAAGCAHEYTIVHDEPHVVSESEARIEAKVISLYQGAVRITAFRVSEKRIEQNYWRRKTSRATGVEDSRTAAVLPATQIASSVGAESPPNEGDSGFAILVLAVIAAVIAVAAVVAAPVLLVVGLVYGTDALVTEVRPVDEQRTTVFSLETVREPCRAATLEAAAGGTLLDLGKQPSGGWVLDAATLERLNLPGSTVILRDGDLSATIVIPNR